MANPIGLGLMLQGKPLGAAGMGNNVFPQTTNSFLPFIGTASARNIFPQSTSSFLPAAGTAPMGGFFGGPQSVGGNMFGSVGGQPSNYSTQQFGPMQYGQNSYLQMTKS